MHISSASMRIGRVLSGLIVVMTALIAAVSANAADRVMQDLAAWYPLGPGADDRSGYELHGDRHDCGPAEDRYLRRLGALELNGQSSWITLPSAEDIFGTDPSAITVSFWLSTTSLNGDGVTVVSDYNSGDWDTRFGFHIWQYVDGRVHATVRKAHLQEWDCATIDPVPLGEWHFVAFTVSKVSGVCRLYLDGELQQELAIATDVDYIEGVPVHLGKSIFQGSDHGLYPGVLDDVRFYRRDLTPAEITDLFQVSLISGLTAHYPLDGNANDASGQGLHGVATDTSYGFDQFGDPFHAASFDGSTSYITLPMSETLLGLDPDAWTVTGWFRTDNLDGDGVTLVSDYNSDSWDTRFGFHVWQYIDGRLHATVRKAHLQEWDCASIEPVPLGEWHSFVFTVSKASGVCRLYLDGVIQQELAIATDVDYIENVPVYLGKSIFQGIDHAFYPGALDEVRFYERELQPDEVADDFVATYATGWAAIYELDGNAEDSGGRHLDGVVDGAVACFDSFGRPDRALRFDGLDDSATLPTCEAILGLAPDAWTVSGWFRTRALTAGTTLVCDYNSSGWDTRYGFHVWQYTDGRLHATVRKQHLGEWDCVSLDPVPLGEWHHFAFTVSKSLGLARLYLDGVIQQELAIATDVDYIENVPVHLASAVFQGEADTFYAGDLDRVRFWDRWVPEAEAQLLYGSGNLLAGNRVAVLITNSQTPSAFDSGFLGVCSELFVYDAVGVDQVAAGNVSLSDYSVVVCAVTGSAPQLAGFDDTAVHDDVLLAKQAGTRFILAGGGAKVVEILGLGATHTGAYSPVLADSWFLVEKNLDHVMLNGVATLDNFFEYTRDELDALEHDALIWRVEPGTSTPWLNLDYTTIQPDFHLGKYVWTGFTVSDPTDLLPFWYNGGANVVYLHPFFWTTDNTTGDVGRIGQAGKLLLANIVEVFLSTVTATPPDDMSALPGSLVSALGSHPNPFNPQTTVAFDLGRDCRVKVTVYSVDGRLVRVLQDGWLAAGHREMVWDGRNDARGTVSSGVYFVHVLAGDDRAVHKVTLLK